jgi:glycosyltransferase involved in cell wall biosynthesis
MVAYTFYETDNRVRRYAETLARSGKHVDAFVLRRAEQRASEVICGVHVHRIQRRVVDETGPVTYLVKLLTFLVRSAFFLTVRHLRRPYALIHVHSVPDFEVFSALVPRLMGAKVILDIHDIVPELYASKFGISQQSIVFRLLLFIERFSMRFANHTIVANHLWHERLITRSVSPEMCTTILNYPDPTIFWRRTHVTGSNTDHFVLFYPGTLSWHQGVDLLIAAVGRLREAEPGLRLVICGDGPERKKLEAMVDALRLRDRVIISGGMALEKVAEMMTRADLGVEPKRRKSFANEALSTKIFEFMAMGVPVLASDTVINRRYFGEGLVEFFASDDIDALVTSISKLMHNATLRDQLRTRGLGYVAQNNWTVKKIEYLQLTDTLVNERDRTIAIHEPTPGG